MQLRAVTFSIVWTSILLATESYGRILEPKPDYVLRNPSRHQIAQASQAQISDREDYIARKKVCLNI